MNTHTLSISSTKEDIDSEITLNQIDLFDFTELTLDISNIYTEIFPTYVSINWGDGSDVFNPDIKIYRDYRNESIFPEVQKGVTPVTFSNNYTHKYYPSSYALKKSLTFKMNVGYVTGETLRLNVPIIVNSQSYYENVDDIDIIGVDLLNDSNNTSRVTLLTKKNNYVVQLDNKSFKDN
tara:strand:+ start:780 stop:1316 length:537 start_codon:yes stop_codon:yes gene_type:complete